MPLLQDSGCSIALTTQGIKLGSAAGISRENLSPAGYLSTASIRPFMPKAE